MTRNSSMRTHIWYLEATGQVSGPACHAPNTCAVACNRRLRESVDARRAPLPLDSLNVKEGQLTPRQVTSGYVGCPEEPLHLNKYLEAVHRVRAGQFIGQTPNKISCPLAKKKRKWTSFECGSYCISHTKLIQHAGEDRFLQQLPPPPLKDRRQPLAS